MQHTHSSCAPAKKHPLHDMWHETCTGTTKTIFLYDLKFSPKHWMGEEPYTLTLRTSQGRMNKERVNWTSDHRHCYYKDYWKIKERERERERERVRERERQSPSEQAQGSNKTTRHANLAAHKAPQHITSHHATHHTQTHYTHHKSAHWDWYKWKEIGVRWEKSERE